MNGYGKRILIIDDDITCRSLLEGLLEMEGYAVQTTCDGIDGLAEMRKRRFDAVITDHYMPRLNGLEFTECSKISWPDTPVILLSGDLNLLTGCEDYDATSACIRKPYEASELLSLLRNVIQPDSAQHALVPTF